MQHDSPKTVQLPDDTQLGPAKAKPAAPVTWLASDTSAPERGLGLSLSGGGTRAMLFHAGALLRLYEMGLFGELRRISSVSGGSITAGVLGLKWTALAAATTDRRSLFLETVVEPVRRLAGRRIDIVEWLRGTLTPGTSPVQRLGAVLDEELFHGATLAELPDDPPRFIFNATNLGTGTLWRFSKPYMGDYRLGRILEPDFRLALAVAASSAFPPFFSPLRPRFDPAAYVSDGDSDAGSMVDPRDLPKFRAQPHLADGGVYDNLGLETIWKRYRDVLVSDGGGAFADDPAPATDLIFQSIRVMKTIDRQVRALRRNILMRSYEAPNDGSAGSRQGAYWGIGTKISDYPVTTPLPCPAAQTLALANEPTRLWRMPGVTQERLVNWGYAAADVAIRAYYRPGLAPPDSFPYPKAKVG